MADYTGLVKIADDFLSFDCGLKCKYNSGNLSKKDYDAELKKKRTELNNLLDDAQSERVIAYKVISGESTLEDLVNSNYKEVEAYVKGFEDFKTFQPDKNLDKKTRLLLRELYDSSKKLITNNPMLTENIKRFDGHKCLDDAYVKSGYLILNAGKSVLSSDNIGLSKYCTFVRKTHGVFGIICGHLLIVSGKFGGISSSLLRRLYWSDSEKVLSVIKDESVAHVVRARRFDEIYSAIKK